MAKDTDGLLLTASLDIDGTYKKIKEEDIAKLNAKLANDNSARVKIIGGLDLNKTQSLIQSQIATIGKNLKLNIGQIDTSSLNTALSNVQNKVIGTNKGLSIKPVIDGKVIEDTDVLIKAVIGKLQQLNNVDLNGFKNNLKNLGFSGKDVTGAADELVHALTLTPENKNVIINSYQRLMDSIRNTITNDSMVADKGFDNRLVMSIYQAISEYKNLEQTAISTAINIKSANEQVEQSNQSIINSEQRVAEALTSTNAQVLSFKQSLQAIGMNNDSINSVINRIEKLNVEVTSLSQSLSTTTGKNGKSILNVEVSGVDKLGQAVKFTQQLDVETGNLIKQIDGVATASTKTASQLDNLMAQQTKRKADLTNQINQIYKSAVDPNASRSITNVTKLDELKRQYNAIDSAIKQMSGTTKTAFAESEAEVTKLIAKLKSTVQEYRNAENVSTTLKPDKLASAISKAESEFATLNTKVANTNVTSEKLKTSLGEIEAILNKPKSGEVINKAEIEQVFTALSKAKSELNALVNTKTSNSAVEKVRIQAETLSNELNAFASKNTGFNTFEQTINGTVISVNSLRNALSGVTSAADFSIIKAQFSALKSAFESSNTDIKKYSDSIDTAILKLHNLQNSPAFLKNSSNSQVVQTKQQIESLIVSYEKLATAINSKNNFTSDDVQNIIAKYNTLDNQLKQITVSANGLKSSLNADNSMQRQAQQVELLVEKVKKLRSEIIAYQNANTKAMKSNRTGSNGITYSAEIDTMLAKLKNASSVTDAEFKKISASFRSLKAEIKSVGLEGGTILGNLWTNIKKFSNWMGITMVTASIAREIRGMFTDVAELDEALIDLRKTFGGTAEDLQKFYYESNNIAKQLGITTKEVISQASAWSRLGYNTTEAVTSLSKTSSIFAAISPEMDVDTATNTLVSVLKAYEKYGLTAEDALDGIASKVNEIGNNFAVSNSDIAEALQRSSASMASANTDLDHTIALITAGNEIAQNPESVGNALKTISMRIRGMNEETEELDGTLQTISGDVYELTHGQVSIMQDADTYKDIYTILDEISQIWDSLTDKEQATLTEKLFGKQRGNIGSAIISNFEQARKAVDTMANSEGGAMREMEVIMDSVSYKANEVKETLVGIAQDTITQDFLKSVLESVTRILNTLSDSSSPIKFILTQIANLLELVTKLTDKIGLIPTILGGLTLKNVGELSLKYARFRITTDIRCGECNTF